MDRAALESAVGWGEYITLMDTLVKWPGGKSGELPEILKRVPDFSRYIEPFAGGAALYFALEPKEAVLGDAAVELMDFYAALGGREREVFVSHLRAMAQGWDELAKVLAPITAQGEAMIMSKGGVAMTTAEEKVFQGYVERWLRGKKVESVMQRMRLGISRETWKKHIVGAALDKVARTVRLEGNRGALSGADRQSNTETGVRAGIYYALRELYNQRTAPREAHTAAWYFVREFCYASMFRFNARGEFNIPYGGMAYNRKGFKSKVEHVTGERVRTLLSGSVFYTDDFEVTLGKTGAGAGDFLFLDPPYDTEFSSYDNRVFAEAEQRRLANYLITTKANWLLVVKDSPLMRELYDNKQGILVEEVDMTYLVNIRNRNARGVVHLYVSNYPLPGSTGNI